MSNGQSIVIKGDISGSEDLVIAGRVEGSITLNGRVLTLAAGSHVVGEIEAGTVVVSGKLEGKVEAKERLDIKSTAVVDGTLSTAQSHRRGRFADHRQGRDAEARRAETEAGRCRVAGERLRPAFAHVIRVAVAVAR